MDIQHIVILVVKGRKTSYHNCSFSALPFQNKSFSEALQASFVSYHKYQLVHLYGPSISLVIYRAVGTGNNFSLQVMLFGAVCPGSTVSHLSEVDFFYIPPTWLINIFVLLVSCFRNTSVLLCLKETVKVWFSISLNLCTSGSSKMHLITAFSFFVHLWKSLIFLHWVRRHLKRSTSNSVEAGLAYKPIGKCPGKKQMRIWTNLKLHWA